MIKICVRTCGMNSTLGSVVPLAIFNICPIRNLFSLFTICSIYHRQRFMKFVLTEPSRKWFNFCGFEGPPTQFVRAPLQKFLYFWQFLFFGHHPPTNSFHGRFPKFYASLWTMYIRIAWIDLKRYLKVKQMSEVIWSRKVQWLSP